MHCSFCGKQEHACNVEKWKLDDNLTVDIARTKNICVEDPHNTEKKVICEACYQADLMNGYSDAELIDIHMQFGIEYILAGRITNAESAFRKLIGIKVTSDGLAHLAYCLAAQNKTEEARNFYFHALEIDPNHAMARNNLAKLK